MKFFLKHLRANRSGTVVMLGFQAGLFLMGVVIVVIINATINEDQDYATIGSLMALMATMFGGLLRGAGAPVRYRMAVSMGYTRRSYIIADPFITAGNALIGVAAAWLLGKVELWFYGLIYPGWECNLDFSEVFFLRWWAILILIVGVVVLDFCLGALQLRFGQKGFLAIWFPLCFSPMVISNAVSAQQEGSTSILAQIGRGVLFLVHLLTPTMWAVVGSVIVLILVVLSAFCYQTAEVRL